MFKSGQNNRLEEKAFMFSKFVLNGTNRLCFMVEGLSVERSDPSGIETSKNKINGIVEKLDDEKFNDLLEDIEWMEEVEEKDGNKPNKDLFLHFWFCLNEEQRARIKQKKEFQNVNIDLSFVQVDFVLKTVKNSLNFAKNIFLKT